MGTFLIYAYKKYFTTFNLFTISRSLTLSTYIPAAKKKPCYRNWWLYSDC